VVSPGSSRALVLFLTLLAAFGSAAAAAAFSVPPTPDHYVTDVAGALDDSTAPALENELRAFEKATSHQVIVYIAQTTGDVPLETYTAQAAHTWRIGRKGKDDGAVLFLFMQDHKVRIEVGYGLESSLTDAAANRIIQDEILPRMRLGDVNAAVTAGVEKMIAAIDPSFTPTATAAPVSTGDGDRAGHLFLIVFLTIFCIPWIIFAILMARALRRGEFITSRGSSGGSSSSSFGGSGGSFDDDSGGDDDFDAGGGDFGGGGASGSW
jgi:uncharacterized protein